jgi:hypothetical protein
MDGQATGDWTGQDLRPFKSDFSNREYARTMVPSARFARALLARPRLTLLGLVVIVSAIAWSQRGPTGASSTSNAAPPPRVETRAPVRAAAAAEDIEPNKPVNARAILSRAWFDKYPRTAKDDVKLWIFFAGGLGIYETGSSWKLSLEIFDFERQGDSVALEFLQDGKKASTKFSIATCDDVPPFDVCLTLTDPPRGPAKYYGFASDDEMNAHLPWARAMIDNARTATTSAR